LTAAGLPCGSCGTELPPNSKFCNECGAPVTQVSRSAEYKQVTVLFADVVHSMEIAAAVGAERLREIMTELVDRAAVVVVVKRYGGTVDKFTGDGIMAVFGAPIALEDHAVRACIAALGVQEEAKRLARRRAGLGWVMAAIEEPVTVLGRGAVACGCGYDPGFLDVESVSWPMNTSKPTIINLLAQASSVADVGAR
jgi:hypothetical protein